MWKVYRNLNEPSPLEANSEINGMNVSISRGSDQLIVENIDACDEADAKQKASIAANQFLNRLSWGPGIILDIDLSAQCVVEHISSTGEKQIGVSINLPIPVPSISVRAEVKDSSGNIIKVCDSSEPGRIEVKPSEAASYYRHAHLTDDPFNRFHGIYLAIENVSSKIQKARGLSKNEVKRLSESGKSYEEGLLKLALDKCFW